ncbi:MAG: alpha-galactosidase [Armatimonadetes bacterium]|nr:alpha-galactosidase [Armatimonadota bacterium]
MNRLPISSILLIATLVLSVQGEPCAAATRVMVAGSSDSPRIDYISGNTIYVEQLVDSRLVGRSWSNNGKLDPKNLWDSDAFEIRFKDKPSPSRVPGTLLSNGWELVTAEEIKGSRENARDFVVELSNRRLPVKAKVHTFLDGTPALTRWLEISNTGKAPIALTALSPWCGRLWGKAGRVAWAHPTAWRPGWEGWLGWEDLKPGINIYKQENGLTWDDPYFILHNEAQGEYFFGQLAWPVNFTTEFIKDDGVSFKLGPTAINALRVIAPGETITTPAVHLAYLKGDFSAAVQAMHEHIRRSVIPKRDRKKAYLVQCLFPEDQPLTVYRGDLCNEENLKKFLDVCEAAGVELFILDGPTWAEGYGNWVPKKAWFPNGLDPIRQYAHQKGMLFGVYAEVEGGRGHWDNTRAWTEHAEWFIKRNPDYPWRNFIRLEIPGAAAYAESELTRIIKDLKIDIYRHDQNGCFGGEGSETLCDGFIENDYWRYYEAWHGIVQRARDKYPDLILHQASGSGSRLELASFALWDENYTSDIVRYPHVYRAASGLLTYLPPEVMVTPIGMAGKQPDRVTMLRSIYALGQTPMIFNALLPKTVEEFDLEDLEKFRHYNKLYKTFMRPMYPNFKVWHHAPVNATGGVEDGEWFAMEFTSPDKKKGWALIIRLSDRDSESYLFKPKGLNAKIRYQMTFDNIRTSRVMTGAELMRSGIDIHPPAEPRSELLLFEAE